MGTADGHAGRPRGFDRDVALDAAMLAFWRTGYEGTSIARLTDDMGITPPSLYAAFGDKRSLFLEAARRYAGDQETLVRQVARAESARDAVRAFLLASAELFTDPQTPPGCLLASATASGSERSADVRAEVAGLRARTTTVLAERIRQDVADGTLPSDADPVVLADLAMAVTQGMSVLARDGRSRTDVVALVDQALAGWPAHHVCHGRG